MALLQSLVTSGRIVDVALAALTLEVIALHWLRRRRGGGISIVLLLVNAGAGASLLLALRAALRDSGWLWIVVFLLSALVFHVADLGQRWESRSR